MGTDQSRVGYKILAASLYIYISCIKAQLANMGNTSCVDGTRTVDSTLCSLGNVQGACTDFDISFYLGKEYLAVYTDVFEINKERDRQLNTFLSIRHLIREIWLDVWLVKGAKKGLIMVSFTFPVKKRQSHLVPPPKTLKTCHTVESNEALTYCIIPVPQPHSTHTAPV